MGNTYIIPGPMVLLYLPNRKIIRRLYSVAVLRPVRRKIIRITKNTPISIPIIVKISEIYIPPFFFLIYYSFWLNGLLLHNRKLGYKKITSKKVGYILT
jgi:hypothetical protein